MNFGKYRSGFVYADSAKEAARSVACSASCSTGGACIFSAKGRPRCIRGSAQVLWQSRPGFGAKAPVVTTAMASEVSPIHRDISFKCSLLSRQPAKTGGVRIIPPPIVCRMAVFSAKPTFPSSLSESCASSSEVTVTSIEHPPFVSPRRILSRGRVGGSRWGWVFQIKVPCQYKPTSLSEYRHLLTLTSRDTSLSTVLR